jgi:magnesium-transporting ATPase (P-type)
MDFHELLDESQGVEHGLENEEMSEVAREYLLQSSRWAKYFGYSSYLSCVWSVFSMIQTLMGSSSSNTRLGASYTSTQTTVVAFSLFVTLISVAIGIYIGNMFLKFSAGAEAYYWDGTERNLAGSFHGFSSVMKIYGVLFILFSVFFLGAILIGFVAALIHGFR